MTKKFLDVNGVQYLAGLLNNYPDNEILSAVINAIQDALDEKASTDLATSLTAGLMSAEDKSFLDNFNPDMRVTLQDMSVPQVYITNAKSGNLINCSCIINPIIGDMIRTTNLLNVNENITHGFYIGSNGTLSSNTNDTVGDFIPVTPGQDIYYTGIIGPTNSSSINRRLHVYDSNQRWIKQLSFHGSLQVGQNWSTHGIVPSNGAYVRVSWGIADTNVQISVGDVAYKPYYITPFTPLSSINVYYGQSDLAENNDLYTINVPNNSIYCCILNPIEGTLESIGGHISSYNNETLPGLWWSDRDTYEEGTLPTAGAEVVYLLDDEDYVEYNITPLTIPLSQGINYFWIENGLITLFEYYAKTLAINHATISDGISLGNETITEQDIINWNTAYTLSDSIQEKANLNSPQFTGSPTAPTAGAYTNSDRLATTAYVQYKMNNLAFNEASMKASNNYTVGQYVCVQGTFYKVIAAVAQNTNFVIGTNIEQTTVGEQLQLLMDAVFNS